MIATARFDECGGESVAEGDGAYLLAVTDRMLLPLVRTPMGAFLVGGGIEGGESAEECLLREAAEEAGFVLEYLVLACITETRFVDSGSGLPTRAENRFFRAVIASDGLPRTEPDHVVAYVTMEEAVGELTLEHQRWAVRHYFEHLPRFEAGRPCVIDSWDFVSSLRKRDVDGVRRCRKADLHNHAVFGGSRKILSELANLKIAPPELPFPSFRDMEHWCDKYVSGPLRSREGFLLRIESALIQAGLDGVTCLHLDVGACAVKHFDSFGDMMGELARLHEKRAPQIDVVNEVSLDRAKSGAHHLDLAIAAVTSGRFDALDMVGDERLPYAPFVQVYREAESRGMLLKVHAGEFGDAEDSLDCVTDLHAKQVQHGVSMLSDASCVRWLSGAGVQLNMCPSSNAGLAVVASYAEHPIASAHRAGVRVTVNTDDVTIFGRGLSEEFIILAEETDLTEEELNQIRLNAVLPEGRLTSGPRRATSSMRSKTGLLSSSHLVDVCAPCKLSIR